MKSAQHWTPRAYRKGKLVSKGLNCLIGTRAQATKLAQRYFSKKVDPGNPDRIDKITLHLEDTASPIHECICLPWPKRKIA